ncbi:NADH-quinone oxidoreductase subunit A [Desulfonatronum thiodismutans]|uniref:NADH-quinone oxidoreductase subunit A n=1 Tax=Desulfonatronum thiodismutans TaxID=159290 RepID=UPI0004ABE4A6|nr:NADH-quinone oxidoreductase subunit A [Desulfonatronum thiodismutans]
MVFTWFHFALLLFLIAGILFAAVPLLVSRLIAPRYKGGDLSMPYECGLPPHGSAWTRFGVNYYFYALIFLAFEVDILYLFPVATFYPHSDGWVPLVKLLIFLFILGISVIYFWRKGVFTWPRRVSL